MMKKLITTVSITLSMALSMALSMVYSIDLRRAIPSLRWLCLFLMFVCFSSFGVSSVQATQVFFVPLEQMAIDSTVIIRAAVRQQRVGWNKSHQRIVTLTEVEVLESLRGAKKGDLLTIYQVGGTDGDITFAIPGASSFVVGEEIVFFAKRFRDHIVSFGMGQGKWSIARHQRAGKEVTIVHPVYGDVAWVQKHKNKGWQSGGEPSAKSMTWELFKARVLKALKNPSRIHAGDQPHHTILPQRRLIEVKR